MHAVVGDVTDAKVRQQVIDETIAQFKRVDFLVNNAGIGMAGPGSICALDNLDKVWDTNIRRFGIATDKRLCNTFSVVHLTSLALPHLKATKGAVVNVSSVAGLRPVRSALKRCLKHSKRFGSVFFFLK